MSAQRNGILLSVAFRGGQQKLRCELERLKQTAALSNGALKQSLRQRRAISMLTDNDPED
jgi:hypothetical protein